MQKLNVLLALFAGLLGGMFSDYLLSPLVQTAVPVSQGAQTDIPNVVAAQRFVLVDSAGNPAGFFTVGTPSGQQTTGASCMTLKVAKSGTRAGRSVGN